MGSYWRTLRRSAGSWLAVSVLAMSAFSCTQDSGVKVYNTAPSISITSPQDGAEFSEGEVITLEALAGDDATANADLRVDFVSDIDGSLSDVLFPDAEGVVVFHTANLSPGNHVVSANVLDAAAAGGSDYVTVTVLDVPDAPEITIVHPVPGEYAVENEAYGFVAMVSDEQEDPPNIQVSIHSDVEGSEPVCVATPDLTGVAMCDAVLTPGEHFITFEAEDSDGYTSTATVYFEVREGALIDDDGDGQTEQGGDCDDTDSSVYEGAEEFQNGVDDDCDGEIDEGTDSYDDDGDCHCEDTPCLGSIEPSCVSLVGGDCDDTNATVYPIAQELCDAVDNDCDGQLDEDDAVDALTWYVDLDADGYGSAANAHAACVAPFGYVADDSDCDDGNASINPAGVESCNGADDDCDGVVDNGVQATFWRDSDGDGHGNPLRPQGACSVPSGYSSLDDDCDDGDAAVNPSANEYCNGIDDDCDATIDEDDAADAQTWFGDSDGDSYGNPLDTHAACAAPSGYLSNSDDCDDTNAAISPAAMEVCDAADNNCDGQVDDATAVDASTWYADDDADGFGDPNDSQLACWQPTGHLLNALDCDDGNNQVHPGATETCNSVDDDCDSVVDDGVGTIFYRDSDGDGYGDPLHQQTSCTQPGGHVSNSDDCNDGEFAIHPAASEVCDNLDNDCDLLVDDQDSLVLGAHSWYRDRDGDTYGDATDILVQCSQPTGYVSDYTDCNDDPANGGSVAYPGNTEICDGVDNNCVQGVDEENASGCTTYYYDGDGDQYGTTQSACYCSMPSSWASQSGDCYDGNSNARPGQTNYFQSDRGDGSWDYNCANGEELSSSDGSTSCGGFSCSNNSGWRGGVPSCGTPGTWQYGCSGAVWICSRQTRPQVQTCR